MNAVYKGKTYRCSIKNNDKIGLMSDIPLPDFEFHIDWYIKVVDRSDCDRLYSITPKVKYQGEEYDYYEETEDKIQLYVTASDLSLEWAPKGFQHTDYEEWTKWVPKSECEKFDKIEDY